jgi:hypothetical protein
MKHLTAASKRCLDEARRTRPFYSGKHFKHGMNLQVIASPRPSTGKDGASFLLPLSRRPSLLKASCPARGFRPSYDWPTAPPAGGGPERGFHVPHA